MIASRHATLLRIFLPLAVLTCGILITFFLLQKTPKARRQLSPPPSTIVETLPVIFTDNQTSISIMGTVIASQSIELRPQVSGQVLALGSSFIPGGRFEKNAPLLTIDPRDYELILQQQQSAVEQALNDIELESGNQMVAKRELALLGEDVSQEEQRLMLREPQLHSLQTALKIVEAKREKAALDLQRTTITAPFNGMVETRAVTIGAWVTTTTLLATLIGTDSFWIEASVPEKDLRWIKFPSAGEKGSPVTVFNPISWNKNFSRKGHVIQLLPALDATSKMARILIEIADPLSLLPVNKKTPQLLLGSFVDLRLTGRPLTQSFKIPRRYLHDGDTLWILSSKGTLDIRTVHIAFRSKETVQITKGVREGEEVIITPLGTPIAEMRLDKAAPQSDTTYPKEPFSTVQQTSHSELEEGHAQEQRTRP